MLCPSHRGHDANNRVDQDGGNQHATKCQHQTRRQRQRDRRNKKQVGGAANLFFVSSVTLTLAACLMLAFGRVLVASVLVHAVVGIEATVAWAKHQAMDMALHAYDVVFYFSSWSTIGFLWRDFRAYVIALI